MSATTEHNGTSGTAPPLIATMEMVTQVEDTKAKVVADTIADEEGKTMVAEDATVGEDQQWLCLSKATPKT